MMKLMGQAGCTTVSRVYLIDCEQQISSWYSYKMIDGLVFPYEGNRYLRHSRDS